MKHSGQAEYPALGTQWVVELYDCPRELISKAGAVEKAMVSAPQVSNSIITKSIFHEFNSSGVFGIVTTLSGAYLSVHTWPEKGYAALDIFEAGSFSAAESAAFVAGRFEAGRTLVYRVPRGRFDRSGAPSPVGNVPSVKMAASVPKLVRAAAVLFGLIY